VRRCVVWEAEKRTFGATPRVHFRGRMYPIYAKDIAKQMLAERVAQEAEIAEKQVAMALKERTGRRTSGRDRKSAAGSQAVAKTDKEQEKLALKHRRASMMSAAADYGMKMRTNQMLRSLAEHADRSASQREPVQPTVARRSSCNHGPPGSPGSSIAPQRADGKLAPSAQALDELDARVEARVEIAIRSMLPELSAAIVADLKASMRRHRRGRPHGDVDAESGDPSFFKPERSRSRPHRMRSVAQGPPVPVEQHEPNQSNLQPSNNSCVAVHVFTGGTAPSGGTQAGQWELSA